MLVLIVGITGDLGQRLARAALDHGLRVRGLGRNPSKLASDISHRLESFTQCDHYYDIPAIDRAVAGVDAILVAYSTNPVLYLDGTLILLRAAERANVKIFVAPTWNSNWTSLQYGDIAIYDSIKAFVDQAELTSTVNPVYILNGAFAEYILTPKMGLEVDGPILQSRVWGNAHQQKIPWTTLDDAAAWTIELILHNKDVLEGKGGFYQFRSGENTLEELASAYERVTGKRIELIVEGSADDLEKALNTAQKEKGKKRFFEYHWLAWNRIAIKGLWKLQNPIDMSHLRPPTTYEEYLKGRFI